MPRRAAEQLLTLLTEELPDPLGLTEAKQKEELRDLGKLLGDKDVFLDLTERDACRVALTIARSSTLQGRACADAAPAVMERANAVQTDADGVWENGTLPARLSSAPPRCWASYGPDGGADP